MDKFAFLNSAIQDTQHTIRAIDFKIGALLAGAIVPFPKIREIFEFLIETQLWWQQVVALIIFILWLLTVFILLAALSAIDSPTNHIRDGYLQNGTYFNGGNFKFSLLNSLFRTSVYSKKNVYDYLQEINDPSFDISKELSFEHLKLTYIRDLKLYRLKVASILIFILLFIGSISFLATPNTKNIKITQNTFTSSPSK